MNTTSDLRRRVDIFLTRKGIASSPRLKIHVTDETVTFRGTVGSYYERQLCLACQHIPGVRRVVDE
jgi:osmotically-inducible protein OsmY